MGGGWVGGGDVNVHWTCTLTWCYATARSLQFTQLRDATLLHVLFNLHNYVMLRWLGWGGGWVGGDVNVHWHWRNHQNKEFCRLLTDISSTTLSKIAGTQQIDRQWLSLKKFVFSNLHRKVKTLVGSEVNLFVRRRCFQYVWRCNLQTCTPLVMLKELAKLVKNNDADNC